VLPVWPTQVLWYALAIAAMVLAIKPIGGSSRLIAGFLAVYYLWMGIVFFAIYYRPLGDNSSAFAVLFALGGALFLLAGVIRRDLELQPKWDVLGVTGGAFMLYGLAYPLLDALNGHLFPAAPVFGVAPCPSAIFTAGLLLWTRRPMPMYVLVVPLIWLMTQAPASALAIGVVADLARVPVGVVTTALLVWREYRAPRERLIGSAILLLAILAVGNATILMALGAVYSVGDVNSVVCPAARQAGQDHACAGTCACELTLPCCDNRAPSCPPGCLRPT
jgi:Family of unknown function (DUF6064)